MEAAKSMFTGRTPEEILELLESNCASKEQIEITVPLSQEEIEILNEEIAELSGKVHNQEKKKEKALNEFKEILKPLKTDLKLKSLTQYSGQKSVQADLYSIEDFDEGLMMFFLPDGKLHSSRRLRQEEKQMRLI